MGFRRFKTAGLLSALVAATFAVLLAFSGSTRHDGIAASPQTVAARASIEDTAVRSPLKLPLARPRIVVEKAARRLTLYAGDERLRVYRVGLGTSPVGDKVRSGDRRTPEGEFFVCVKNERSAFYLSLGISYPDERAAERGLRDGLITRAQYRRIMNAARRKRTPPWDTALGGEIFIHGRGASSDWTWGCIALEDEDIKELFDAVPVGTPVRIEP
ncbi:MAG TPA: L,D-transpeptidase [Pyrinomonadaceae bacterium]|nr:L,D-transpeptidase [Pyrinomonadaceae bacterium]